MQTLQLTFSFDCIVESINLYKSSTPLFHKITATYYAVNPFFGVTSEVSWFPISAVVLVIAVYAISWQETTQPPTGTL